MFWYISDVSQRVVQIKDEENAAEVASNCPWLCVFEADLVVA